MMLTLSCLVAALLSATGPVATVDGVEITLPEVLDRASELGAPGKPSTPEQAFESVVLDVLLSAEARRTGLAGTPAVRERLQREKRRAAAQVITEKELASLPPPSETDLRRLYHATADSVRLRMLVFPTEDAARVNLAIVQRSGNFDDAARSAVPGLEPPGGNAPKIRGQLAPRLADRAFEVPIGTAAGPVELEDGWAIIKVLDRTIGDEKGFASQRASIQKFAREQNAESVRLHVRERLRRKARITTDDAFLESLGKRLDATASELEHVVATVDGKPLRYREVEPSVRQLSTASGHSVGPGLRKQLLMNEIEERLVENAAAARAIPDDPASAARARVIERRVLAAALVEHIGASTPAPSAKEIRAFYQANVAATGRDLESTRSAIAQQLLESRRAEALRAKVDALRSRAAIVIDRRALQAANRP